LKVGNSDVPAILRTEHLTATSHNDCCLIQPFWCIIFAKSLNAVINLVTSFRQ